ncbi:AAA family ATPase [Promicromonospora soli]
MILLRFRVENHRSIRDEAVLSLVRPSLTTLHPRDGDWVSATTRVAGIYGANASGKSTVVDALKFFRATVMNSATSWSLHNKLPQQPFLLDPETKDSRSGYAVDFVLNDMRYQYGFVIDRDAVRQEWLFDYPSTKHRVLFEREGHEFKFGRALLGAPRTHASATGEREPSSRKRGRTDTSCSAHCGMRSSTTSSSLTFPSRTAPCALIRSPRESRTESSTSTT